LYLFLAWLFCQFFNLFSNRQMPYQAKRGDRLTEFWHLAFGIWCLVRGA
jgi:hypothetical protein